MLSREQAIDVPAMAVTSAGLLPLSNMLCCVSFLVLMFSKYVVIFFLELIPALRTYTEDPELLRLRTVAFKLNEELRKLDETAAGNSLNLIMS